MGQCPRNSTRPCIRIVSRLLACAPRNCSASGTTSDLEVTPSLGRPQVSNGNPFSEAQFKTLKCHPDFPGRFEDVAVARTFCCSWFPWSNIEHRHAGIAMLTPHDVGQGRARRVLKQCERTLRLAWT